MKRSYLIAGAVMLSLAAASGAGLARELTGPMGGPGMGPMAGPGMGPMGGPGMGPMAGPSMIRFDDADANGDGKLTKEEMDAFAKTRFNEADSNGDGKLTLDEMTQAAEKRAEMMRAKRAGFMAARMIERFDQNEDGALSPEEMPGQQRRADMMFDRLDADGDGALSKEEMEAARENFRHRHGKGDGEGRHRLPWRN